MKSIFLPYHNQTSQPYPSPYLQLVYLISKINQKHEKIVPLISGILTHSLVLIERGLFYIWPWHLTIFIYLWYVWFHLFCYFVILSLTQLELLRLNYFTYIILLELLQLTILLKIPLFSYNPKDPQLSKSLHALKQVFKSGWNVFDFSYAHPSTAYDPTFYFRLLFYSKNGDVFKMLRFDRDMRVESSKK